LDLTGNLSQELRICEAAIERARSAKLKYPISIRDELNAIRQRHACARCGDQMANDDIQGLEEIALRRSELG
jgi:hypothetical protein